MLIGSIRVGVPKFKPKGARTIGKGVTIIAPSFTPSLDFSDPRNSQYIPLLFSKTDWSIERLYFRDASAKFALDFNMPKGVV